MKALHAHARRTPAAKAGRLVSGLVLCGVCGLSLARGAFAADLEARVSADRERLAVGDEVVVTLEVTRSGRGALPQPELPRTVTENFIVGECGTRQGSQTQFLGNRIATQQTVSQECS